MKPASRDSVNKLDGRIGREGCRASRGRPVAQCYSTSLDGVSLFVIHDVFVVVLVVIFLIVLIIFVILIVGDDVDAHRVDLNHLELGGDSDR